MAKNTLESWDTTAGNNTDVSNIDITGATGYVRNGDNAMRAIMAQAAAWLGSDTLASATTTDLGSVNGRYVSITGTTTITGFGTIKAGTIKHVVFAGILTLTHNATSLILRTGANITTVAGDTATFASEGSGNWRCLDFTTVDGRPLATNPLTLTYVDAGASAGPVLDLYRDSSSPAASDILGKVIFNGRDSAANKQEYASIETVVADPTSATEDSAIDVYLQLSGARTRYIGIGRNAAGTATANAFGLPLGQISFPATQNASSDANTLDDYDETSWTPTLTFGGGSTGIVYTTRSGWMTTIGNLVVGGGRITLSNKGSSTGNAAISGLTYTSATFIVGTLPYYSNMSGMTVSGIFASSGATSFEMFTGGAASSALLTNTSFTNTSDIAFFFSYQK